MNTQQYLSVLRGFLLYAMAYATGRGWLTSDQAAGLVSSIMDAAPQLVTLAVVLWGVFAKRDAAQVKQAAQVKGVTSISVAPFAASDSVVAVATDSKVTNVNLKG